jgi:thiaminase/transcriptional activator TenA
MLHEKLWQENMDLATACLHHPFVKGLGDGSLDQAAFKRYVAQDAFFLQAFVRAYALAAAKSRSMEHSQSFHTLMGGGYEELKLHESYSSSLGIDIEKVQPYPAASAYTNFLLGTAWHRGVDEITAALAPCMKLYSYLGIELNKNVQDNNPYRDWITTYSSVEFKGLVEELEGLLDSLASDTAGVREAYRYAMQCEFDFFSAPLEQKE